MVFSNNELIFVYESLEYFNENNDRQGWKNFKGLTAWESRYYVDKQSVKFQKHRGRTNIQGEATKILQDAKAVLKFVIKIKLSENIKWKLWAALHS